MENFIRGLSVEQIGYFDALIWVASIVFSFVARKVVDRLRPWEWRRFTPATGGVEPGNLSPSKGKVRTLYYKDVTSDTEESLLAVDWRERLDAIVSDAIVSDGKPEAVTVKLFSRFFWRTLAFIATLRVGMLWLLMYRVFTTQGHPFDLLQGLCVLPDGLWLGYLMEEGPHLGLAVAVTCADMIVSALISTGLSFYVMLLKSRNRNRAM